MSGVADLTGLSAVRLALLAEETRAQSAPLLRADPIAIVGMACRTPGGGDTPEKLWRNLAAGVEAVSEIPSDRFDVEAWYDADPSVPGKLQARRAGFLDQIDQFDADYFGILGREADYMDPQQRLAMEAAIEAIDDAGAPHETLRGSRTGVYMACYHSDYARLVYGDLEALDTRVFAGTLHGVVANRISHFLDLRGPSLTLDTGCSSSLVALHLACQSLRMGEIDFALAGGVSVMIGPELFVAMTKVGFMAPDGRCKTFDARADGFGRGEGCGMVALKRLSDAVADGDRIYALVRGTAVNQDGRSTVLTAPNGKAQEALLREALTSAAVPSERVAYVEAHGTGTALGDPIEVEALATVLGAGDQPCYVGSAKANIGHLEAAAGVIGLIKAVQVLRHGTAPPQPNFETLSPHIDLRGARLKIPAAPAPLAVTAGPRCAAVSSFGIGGTNGHAVLEEAPRLPGAEAAPDGAMWTLPLSARTPEGLVALASSWAQLLDDPEGPSLGDLCFTAALRRSHYPLRIAVSGRTKAELSARLAAVAPPPVTPAPGPARVGFVFSGQGPQWWAMGRQLLDSDPVFIAAMQKCDKAIAAVAGWSVIDELRRDEASSRLAETIIAQPALFALQTALAAVWNHWGVRPAAVAGHSVGEIAALHVAGVLSLQEAARVVVRRGAAMQAATGGGGMAAVPLTEAQALELVARWPGRLDVAAVNAPASTVISGEAAALGEALSSLRDRGVSGQALKVDYAFHSSQMASLASAFAAELGAVACAAQTAPVYSTLTGARLDANAIDAAYFADAIRKPVRFADAVAAMRQSGVDTFLEIGPHPALAAAIAETLESSPPRAIAASLRRGRDEPESLRNGLAALYAAGVDPDWREVLPAEGNVVTLPAYPWRRRRHWIPRQAQRSAPTKLAWVGQPSPVAGTDITTFALAPEAIADWAADHRIHGEAVVPGVALAQAMSQAGALVWPNRTVVLQDLLIREPLRMAAGEAWQIVADANPRQPRLAVHARSRDGAWRLVAEAGVSFEAAWNAPGPAGGTPADLDPFFGGLSAAGVEFGPAFRSLRSAAIGSAGAEGSATLSPGTAPMPGPHPALLDAGLQLAILAAGDLEDAFLPLGVDRVWLSGAADTALDLRARVVSRSPAAIVADVFGYGEDGALAAAFEGVRFVKAPASRFAARPGADEAYRLDWTVVAASDEAVAPKAWAIFEDAGGVAAAFAAAAEADGAVVQRLPVDEPHAALSQAQSAGVAVALFQSLDVTDEAPDSTAYAAVLDLLKTLSKAGPRDLLIVTSGASGLDASSTEGAVRGAGLAALARVAALEHPDLRLRTVDVDPLASPQAQGRAVLAALKAAGEPELAVRGDELRAPRLKRVEPGPADPTAVVQVGEGLDGVGLQSADPGEPGPGELRIRVRAAGLNFRDTLVALGAYPGGPAPLGAECAGIVEAMGEGVTGFAIGDRVASLAQGCLATHARARAELTVRIPDGLRFDLAAAAPVAFTTCDIGLRRLAGMTRGDRVLIHAATGGVGLAALALAQRAGAEVFATAGTPEKRAYLRRRGVTHVFDSRSLDFADEILRATNGEGVRIVLNSLTGAFVGASLRALAKGGVFLELGKREIWTPEAVAAERPDVAYHVFDAGEMAQAEPALFQDALSDAFAAIVAGEMPPPLVTVRPLGEAREALRRMAQARHMGKLVLAVDGGDGSALPVRNDGLYLVTGGLGGIGLQAASWLVGKGARRLVLVGRSPADAAASQAIAVLEGEGANVRVVCADIADAAALREGIGEVSDLRGIVHAAGVPANGLLDNLDVAAISEARRGKVEGARALRQITEGVPLDFVVLSSSAANLFGAPGQGAYAAANAELEAFARDWRAQGAPVLTVAWGPWADAGMFARMGRQARDAWKARGLKPMGGDRAFAALDRLADAQLGFGLAADVDWKAVFAAPPAHTAALSALAPKSEGAQASTRLPQAGGDIAHLRSLPGALQRSALVEALTAQARVVLELAPGAPLPAGAPLKAHGLDSLMAVELRNHLARFGGVALPATLAFDHPTIEALADRLSIVWGLETPKAAPPQPRPAPTLSDLDLDALSDEDAEALLAAELESLSSGRAPL